jgi:outer membrane protein assembly complex protein YaeT
MRLRLFLLVALVLGIAAPAAAQRPPEAFSGRQVAQVRVFVEGVPTTDTALVDLIETPVGQPLSMAAVRASIAHLYSLGRFQDIQVEAVDAANGAVELRYNLVAVRAVDRVEFRGSLGLSEGRLRDALNDRFGRTPQPGRAPEVVRVLEQLYQDNGYFRTSIRPNSEELHSPERTILIFEIEAGPQARVGNIEVVGEPQATQEAVLQRLVLSTGRVYERARLDERLDDYSRRLKGRGYLRAAASHVARVSEDGRTADVRIDIQSGPMVTVSFEGDALPADKQSELVPFEREGSVDEDLLEDSVGRIRAYLQQQGFWKADVAVRPLQTNDTLNIVFFVRKGPAYRVASEGVQITGNQSIPIEEIRPLVVLQPGAPYVESHLDATVGALIRLYTTRGFRWASVKSGESESDGSGQAGVSLIHPTIAIVEGPRAVLDLIAISGASAVSEGEIRRLLQVQTGQPFYEPSISAGRDAVQLEYLNLGFSSAEVVLTPSLSEDRTRVALNVTIREGPQTFVDHLIIVGNRRTSEEVIRREVLLRPGAPLGLRDLLESRRRLSSLGLFRRIDIRQVEHGSSSKRDVLVTVEEAPATTISYGGGVELTRRLREGVGGLAVERIELAPRGFFDIGRRNLGGKNRSVNLFTRVSVRPKDAPDDPLKDGTGLGLSEYRVVGTYREPAAVFRNADLTLTGAIEEGVRSSFNFTRKGVTADLSRLVTPIIRTSARYAFSSTRTFDERLDEEEQATIDRIFPEVRLSTVSGALVRDTRDDVAEPSRGDFFSGEVSLATRALGGEVGFLKTYLQGYWFTRLPGPRAVILATRASIGLADGFPRESPPTDDEGNPIEGEPIIIEDLPASERFFAGGDTTIRGFALDTVGTPETISPSGFPRGGNGVLIMNVELRVPVIGDFGAALFSDGGNVWERVTDFDITQLRGSVGFGVRYRSPIGPIRVDLGFKLDRRLGESRQVLHFSIGQAF